MSPTALRTFGAELVDYAGLFPPSKLPMEQAVPNYLAYRAGDRAPLLGRFICPVGRLAEMNAFADQIRPAGTPDRVRIAALPRGGDTSEAYLSALAEDLATIRSFVTGLGNAAMIDTLETRLPADLAGQLAPEGGDGATARETVPAVREWMQAVLATLAEHAATDGGDPVALYVELPYSPANADAWRGGGIAALIEALGTLDAPAATVIGAKVRCGGTAPPPTVPDLLAAIEASVAHKVPLKYTAGLHHAITAGPTEERPGYPHGYLNLFAATALAHVHGFDADRTRTILESANPADFYFHDDGVAFQESLTADDPQLQVARRFATSFGSCDFTEPTDDLLRWSN